MAMNNYQQKYIELKKEYERFGKDAERVQALYEYKDFLEAQATPEAGWVLVDVYMMVNFRTQVLWTARINLTSLSTAPPAITAGSRNIGGCTAGTTVPS